MNDRDNSDNLGCSIFIGIVMAVVTGWAAFSQANSPLDYFCAAISIPFSFLFGLLLTVFFFINKDDKDK